jgi:hypothetical protein
MWKAQGTVSQVPPQPFARFVGRRLERQLNELQKEVDELRRQPRSTRTPNLEPITW